MANVLIIDDSRTVVHAASRILKMDGHQTEGLSRFTLLADVLGKFAPDIVVLDLHMPGFSGVQFGRFIRRYCEKPPAIILYSGADEAELREAAAELDVVGVVTKTQGPDALRDAVRVADATLRAAIRRWT